MVVQAKTVAECEFDPPVVREDPLLGGPLGIALVGDAQADKATSSLLAAVPACTHMPLLGAIDWMRLTRGKAPDSIAHCSGLTAVAAALGPGKNWISSIPR